MGKICSSLSRYSFPAQSSLEDILQVATPQNLEFFHSMDLRDIQSVLRTLSHPKLRKSN
jgi:hypothetical protein